MSDQPGTAKAYERHTGRYSAALGSALVDFACVEPQMRVLDVGCGTGGLTEVVSSIVGPQRVAGVDPSEEFLAACRARIPEAEVHVGTAEELPFEDGDFDCVLSQMVMQALDNPPRAAQEMLRVCAPGGTVATCVWDFDGGMPLLDAFWDGAMAVDPEGVRRVGADEPMPWCTAKGLERFWREGGVDDVVSEVLSASAEYEDVDDAWRSFAEGAGVSGGYCRSLDDETRTALREEFERRLGAPDGRFTLTGRAWASRARAAQL